jgi:MFS family permease
LPLLINPPHAPAAHPAQRTVAAGWVLAGLSLATLLASLGTSVANVGLPSLAQAFGASFQAVQWIVLAYLLAITTLVVAAGRLGDVVGRRRLLLCGIALFTGASVICGLAPTLWALIAARAAQGIGAAVMMALPMAFVGDTVPAERTGRAMGLLGTMSAIGTALGPALGGVLIAGAGWRALFLVHVPVGAAALWLAHRHLPPDGARRTFPRSGLDVAGTVLLAATLAAYALAMTVGRGRAGGLSLVLLSAAALGAALFTRIEARAPSPLVRLSRLRDRSLGAGLAANALVSTVMMATLVVGPFYLTRTLALAPALVGLLMTVGPLVAAVAGVPSGGLVDRIGARATSRAGLGAMATGAALLAALPTTWGVAGYAGPLAVVTAGYALFQAANNTAVMTDVPAGERGVVAGLLGLSRNLGLVTGASAMGALFALASGATDVVSASAAAVAAGMRVTFATAAALAVVAIAVTARGRVGRAKAATMLAAMLVTLTPSSRGHAQQGAPAPMPADPYPVVAAGWGPPIDRARLPSGSHGHVGATLRY